MKPKKMLLKQFTPLIIILFVILIIISVVSPVIAYYIKQADDASTQYTPAKPNNPSFNLDSTNNKEMNNVNIEVEDNGYPVYVRVAIIVTWQKQGDETDVNFVTPRQGEGKDYIMNLNKTDWQEINNYHYYVKPVVSGGVTANLIDSCTLLNTAQAPEGYVLSVEIIVQTIQAIGYTDDTDNPVEAWKDAWGIGPDSWKTQNSNYKLYSLVIDIEEKEVYNT